MPKFICLVPGKELPGLKEDFQYAQRLEQYRIGALAVYQPRGFAWEYIPRSAITGAERSHRVISAGHCVTVREEKPAVDLWAGQDCYTLNLEKPASAETVLNVLAEKE